jgi:hypothetical protein
MKKLKSIMITVSALLLLTGALGTPCLAGTPVCYLPLISYDPPPPIPPVTPVTPELVVGTWLMINAATGLPEFYLHIGSDNSLAINDYPDDTEHLPGNWEISGDAFLGHFTNINLNPEDYNPTGDLVGTILYGVFTLDFIEYWHDPPKHVPYTAARP